MVLLLSERLLWQKSGRPSSAISRKPSSNSSKKAFEQAVAAQREYADQFNANPFANMEARQEQHEAEVAKMQARYDSTAQNCPEMPQAIAKRMEESKARRDEMVKEMEARPKVAMERKPFEKPVWVSKG